MIYRGVEIAEWNENFVKLYYQPGKHKFAGVLYTNGEKYASVPPAWAGRALEYAKRLVDRTYEWAEYHRNFEERYYHTKSS